MFTSRYGLSPYITQIRVVFKGLIRKYMVETDEEKIHLLYNLNQSVLRDERCGYVVVTSAVASQGPVCYHHNTVGFGP